MNELQSLAATTAQTQMYILCNADLDNVVRMLVFGSLNASIRTIRFVSTPFSPDPFGQ